MIVVIPVRIDDVETVRYTYRLRPGAQAAALLHAEWDRCRWVWNQCVGRDHEICAEGGPTPSGYDLCAELTDWRGRYEWLRAGSQNAQACVVNTWHKARQAAFKVKGCGRPNFKSRRVALPSLEYTTRGFRFNAGRLVVAGGVTLPVVWHRDLPSKPTSVRVFADPVGHWWASFVVRREVEVFPEVSASIGVDWGVTATATTTDPEFDQPHAEHGKTAAAKLAAYQRRMARRKPARGQDGSRGYGKAKRGAAKLHIKVANQRRYDAIIWARQVATHHDLIAVEDFKPAFLAKSTLARKAADGGIGATKRTLIEYGNRAGRTVILVPAPYTTQTCSECGTRTKTPLGLKDRIFSCDDCGLVLDRDRNAARTILASAEITRADVESRRHDPPFGFVQLESENRRP